MLDPPDPRVLERALLPKSMKMSVWEERDPTELWLLLPTPELTPPALETPPAAELCLSPPMLELASPRLPLLETTLLMELCPPAPELAPLLESTLPAELRPPMPELAPPGLPLLETTLLAELRADRLDAPLDLLSVRQVSEQPSPFTALASSHSSPATVIPSPQTGKQTSGPPALDAVPELMEPLEHGLPLT